MTEATTADIEPPRDSGAIISATNLTRTYRTKSEDIEAVRGIDLTIAPGEIVGFLGPNGAGKTTTLRMLTTLLDPTDGEATVAGADLRRDPRNVRERIGYVAQGGMTFPEARAGEEVVDHGRLFGMSRSEATERGRRLFELLDLDGTWDRRCDSLSGGQRRRLDIALGLIHSPRLVFLDEPSTGLDPQARANLWDHIRGLRDNLGTTVFLTTHYMDEADLLCDRLLIIDHGEIVSEGSPKELKRSVGSESVKLTMKDPADAEAVATRITNGGFEEITRDGSVVFLPLEDATTDLSRVMRMISTTDLDPLAIEVHTPTLDDVFLTLTGRSLRDEAAVNP